MRCATDLKRGGARGAEAAWMRSRILEGHGGACRLHDKEREAGEKGPVVGLLLCAKTIRTYGPEEIRTGSNFEHPFAGAPRAQLFFAGPRIPYFLFIFSQLSKVTGIKYFLVV
jgi:hypothetical protein